MFWDLMNIVIPKVKPHWIKLAYSMEYDVSAVKGFEGDGRNLDAQCYKLFEDWVSTGHGCTPKTWQTLLHRIERVDELSVAAEEIKQQLAEQIKQQLVEKIKQQLAEQ